MSSLTIFSIPGTPQAQPRSLQGLPPFPAAASRLLGLLSQEDFEPAELVAIVKGDPMFAAELLRTVNSARYARSQEISGIQHAAALLGRETLRSFATAVSLRLYVGKAIQKDELARVWRHSLAVAASCEVLTQSEERRNPVKDVAYVAGLLHDVGCLGLMVLHPADYSAVLARASETGANLCALEDECFGMDHCVAGQWIAHNWKFGPEIEDVALHHHEPLQGHPVTVLEIVKAAVLLADALGWSSIPSAALTPEEAVAQLPTHMQQRIKIAPDHLYASIAERIGMFDQAGAGTTQNACKVKG